MQEWAAAEALVGRVADRLRAGDLSTEALVCAGRPSEAIPKYSEARVTGTIEHLRGCSAQVRGAVRFGHPADEILSAARDQAADLVVGGAGGRTRTGPFRLDRVAQEVVRYAPCSALVGR